MKTETIKKVKEFLNDLETEITILDYIDVEDINLNNPFQSIFDQLTDLNAFNIEIIYYYKAMEYLTQNDHSLSESIEIALEYGYSLQDVNSELLASLLASRKEIEKFYDLETEITDFFEKINLIEEEEQI